MLDLDSFKDFTPGPWVAVTRTLPKAGQKHELRQNKINAWTIGEIVFPHDLALIAAAPDLLALAKQQRDRIKELELNYKVAKELIEQLYVELAQYKYDNPLVETIAPDDKPLVSLPDPTREQHRALVEAGYAPLSGYILKYGSEK